MTDSPEAVMAQEIRAQLGTPYQQAEKTLAARIHAALRAAGYAIVPVEPTEKMVEAAHTVIAGDDGGCPEVYRAMVAAAEES